MLLQLESRGICVRDLLKKHETHQQSLGSLLAQLAKLPVMELRVVRSWQYTDDEVNWADCIVSCGGNGTFLMVAARIRSVDKPLMGVTSEAMTYVRCVNLSSRTLFQV